MKDPLPSMRLAAFGARKATHQQSAHRRTYVRVLSIEFGLVFFCRVPALADIRDHPARTSFSQENHRYTLPFLAALNRKPGDLGVARLKVSNIQLVAIPLPERFCIILYRSRDVGSGDTRYPAITPTCRRSETVGTCFAVAFAHFLL